MHITTLPKDILIACVTASSFPAGIMQAFQKLHSIFPPEEGRTTYGISHGDGNGGIIYKAATAINSVATAEAAGLESFTIKGGKYRSHLIHNFMADTKSIGRTFSQMLALPGVDLNGYCLEEYINNTDVRCLVKLVD